MYRRTFLATGVAAGSCLIAGCSSVTDDGPVETVRAYIRAINDNDQDRLEELIHPDSMYEQQPHGMGVESIEIELHEATLVEEETKSATVEIDSTVTAFGTENRESQQIDLQKHEGDWYIW